MQSREGFQKGRDSWLHLGTSRRQCRELSGSACALHQEEAGEEGPGAEPPSGRRPGKSARWYELLRNARDCRPTLARDDRSGSRGRSECELRVGCGNAAQGIEIPDSRSLRDEWCVCAMRGRRVSLSWERASAAQAATSTPSGSGGRARHHGHSVRRGAGRQAALRARPRTSLTRRPRPGRAEPSGARSSRG